MTTENNIQIKQEEKIETPMEKEDLTVEEIKNKLIIANKENISQALHEDPFLGYKSIQDAVADCKANSQVEVLARLLNHENIFISGPAGSGKSTIINPFLQILENEFPDVKVALTAYTGIAATNIGGVTLHSWAGIRNNQIGQPYKVSLGPYYEIKTTDVLVIDEVSMVPAYLFTELDEIMRRTRNIDKPFGGVQLILIGDFMQLPPIQKRDDELDTRFCVFSDSWKDAEIKLCYMDKVHRASDKRLEKVLNLISRDKVDENVKKMIDSRKDFSLIDPNKTYVRLFPTNREIDEYNAKELAKINSQSFKFNVDLQQYDYYPAKSKEKEAIDRFMKSRNYQDVELKIGAPVILTKNFYIPKGGIGKDGKTFEVTLVPSGSIGKIHRIDHDNVLVKFNNGKFHNISRRSEEITMDYYKNEPTVDKNGKKTTKKVKQSVGIASVHFMPLRIGYAISVHKSQGQTYDGVIVDLTKAFAPGIGYVALSRVRSMDDLVISGISQKALQVDKKSLQISTKVKKNAVETRKEFINEISLYEDILTNVFMRQMVWLEILEGKEEIMKEFEKEV